MSVTNVEKKGQVIAWLICGMGMMFYFYNFFLRVTPGIMHDNIVQAFNLNSYQFGTLSAFYYYAYTPMQVPAGALYDRFGIKLVQVIAILIASIGLLIFTLAGTYHEACLGRFLIGFGGAFAYVGVLKLVANWLPANKFALAAGLTTTLGMTAAALSDSLLSRAVTNFGYKPSLYFGLAFGVALSIVVMFFMKNHPKENTENSCVIEKITNKHLLEGFKKMLLSPQMWLIGVVGCLTYMPSTVFLDLWGIPFLQTSYHYSVQKSGLLISNAFLGWIIGGPVIGMISDKIKLRKLPLLVSYVVASALFIIMIFVPNLNEITLSACLFIIGVCCSSHSLCLTLGKENNSKKFSGISVAFCNCLTMLGGLIFQPVVGHLLDVHAHLHQATTVVYSAYDYTYSLAVIPIGLVVSLVLMYFIRETRCGTRYQ